MPLARRLHVLPATYFADVSTQPASNWRHSMLSVLPVSLPWDCGLATEMVADLHQSESNSRIEPIFSPLNFIIERRMPTNPVSTNGERAFNIQYAEVRDPDIPRRQQDVWKWQMDGTWHD